MAYSYFAIPFNQSTAIIDRMCKFANILDHNHLLASTLPGRRVEECLWQKLTDFSVLLYLFARG